MHVHVHILHVYIQGIHVHVHVQVVPFRLGQQFHKGVKQGHVDSYCSSFITDREKDQPLDHITQLFLSEGGERGNLLSQHNEVRFIWTLLPVLEGLVEKLEHFGNGRTFSL